MENFRFKTKRNQIFNTYSNFKQKLSLNKQTFKENQQYFLPNFKQNYFHQTKQNNSPSKKYPNLPFSNNNTHKKYGHKYSKSTHEKTPQYKTKEIFTCRQQNLRRNILLTEHDKIDQIQNPKFNLKKIQIMMMKKKENFEWTLRQSCAKLNCSYKNSLEGTLKYDMANYNQLRLSQSQSMDIKMETKSRKKIVFKGDSKFMENINKQKSQHEDVFVKQNNLFSVIIQSKKCMDGIFPMFRNGATLSSISSSVYLYGGINSKLADSYHFHEYLGNQKQWICIKNQQNSPNIVPSFHTVQTYKNSLIFIGGSTLNSTQSNKVFNPDILIYDTDKQQFAKIKWNINLRSHASTIYSNMLVVYGGIDQHGLFSNKLYFLPLNTNNISQTNPNPYNLGSLSQGIANHKIVNTFEVDNYSKSKLQMDGIICYGGKYANGKLNNDILLFRFNKNKQSTQTERIIKGWQIVQTNGLKPQPRCCHSMNIIYKKCICFIIGGVDVNGIPLNDAWILDLTCSAWIQAIFQNKYEVIERGIFSHATTVMNGQIYVFGGFNGENKLNNQFWSIDFSFNRAAKKQQELKKSRNFIPSSSKLTKQTSKMKCVG